MKRLSYNCYLEVHWCQLLHNDDIVDEPLFFISDDLCHMVYKIIKEIFTYVTEHVDQQCSLVHYFSDGCESKLQEMREKK